MWASCSSNLHGISSEPREVSCVLSLSKSRPAREEGWIRQVTHRFSPGSVSEEKGLSHEETARKRAALHPCALTRSSIDPSALAEESSCRGTLGRITLDNVRVPAGATCTLSGTTVKGNIVVERGGPALHRRGHRQWQHPGKRRRVRVGWLRLSGSRTAMCRSVPVVRWWSTAPRSASALQVVSNIGASQLSSNYVKGNIQVFSHSGGISITSNRVDANLQCKGNVPAPTGGGNVVSGVKQDQCARL